MAAKKSLEKKMSAKVKAALKALQFLEELPLLEQIGAINRLREEIHKLSPFCDEPVDFVKWVPHDEVVANDYNPNSVAPPEMELLQLSITVDGFTQPIVTMHFPLLYEVVDGFHRNRVGKECPNVRERVHGHLPIVQIKNSQSDVPNRMASTIRHNRARGKHLVEGMSDIVLGLKRRNWSDKKIGHQLGMDHDEVLRLTQISGLAEMFTNQEFSEAWEAGTFSEEEAEKLDYEEKE